jgi:flavin reductase (DIM6/NTAB) family NADH-FMN oxidoreductase RutF
MRRNLEEEDARRLLGGSPVTLITCSYKGKHNVLPVAYVMPVSIRPPLIAVSMSASRYSYDMIHKTEEFAINLPSRRLLHHVQFRQRQRLRHRQARADQLPSFRARRLDTVLLEAAPAGSSAGSRKFGPAYAWS